MMTQLNGLERTLEQFEHITSTAGFKIDQVFVTRGVAGFGSM